MRRLPLRIVRIVGLPVALLALYWLVSLNSQSYYFSSPADITRAFVKTWIGPRILSDLLPSVGRLAVGYLLAALLGIGLGLGLGLSRRLRALAEPLLEFFRAVPPPVLVPLLILLAGVSDMMKVLVVVSGCAWPVLLNTVEGVRAVEPQLIDTCRSFGIRGVARLRHLILPAASPQIITGLRQALPVGIILMVISEMFASSSGLGFTIVQFQRTFAIPEMWSGIVLLGLLGVVLSALFRVWERRVLSWYYGARALERGGG